VPNSCDDLEWSAPAGVATSGDTQAARSPTNPASSVGSAGVVPGGIQRWVPVVVIAIAALPLVVLATLVLARRRGDGLSSRPETRPDTRAQSRPQARRRAMAEVGMVAGTLPWIWMILTPLPAARQVHLVPFVDVADLLAGDPAFAFFQIVGNLLVFAAFGFFAPWRWPGLGVAWVAGVAAGASVVVETLQYSLALGRVSSVDDVLLNAAGAALAAAASRRWVNDRSARDLTCG
jgi:hypothetical protein